MKFKNHNLIRRNESGFILAFFALLIPILMGFFALTVDLPTAYSYNSNIKSAVDLATLAGVSQLQSSADVTQAKLAAVTYLNNNLSMTIPGFTNLSLPDPNLSVQVGIYDHSTGTFTWDESSDSVNAIKVSYSHQVMSILSGYFMVNGFNIGGTSIASKYYAGKSSVGTLFPLAIEKDILTDALSTSSQRVYQFGSSTNSYFTAFDNNASVGDIEDTIDYFQGMSGTPSRAVTIGDQFKYNSGALATSYLYINLIFPWSLPGNTFIFPVVTKGSGNNLTAEGFAAATITGFGLGSMGYYIDLDFEKAKIDNSWGGLQAGPEPTNINTDEKSFLATAYSIVQ